MKVLSVSEFNSWVKESRPEYYVFSSENNRVLSALGIQISERYQSVAVSASYDRICFQSGSNKFCLDHVKEVLVYSDIESIGVVFDIVCDADSGKFRWRLIAD